jgi:hypothetical protein
MAISNPTKLLVAILTFELLSACSGGGSGLSTTSSTIPTIPTVHAAAAARYQRT